MTESMFCIAAGLMTLSVASAQSGFDLGRAAATPVTVPRWVPYAVLGVLAVASAVVGAIFPEAIGAALD